MPTPSLRHLLAAARHVEGLTTLVERLPACARCQPAVRDAVVRKEDPAAPVALCERHFEHVGGAVGRAGWRALVATGPCLTLDPPRDARPAGYALLIQRYHLAVLPPPRLTWVAVRGARRELVDGNRHGVVLPRDAAPGEGLGEQLEFSLKHDGVNLEVLAALFARLDPSAVEQALAAHLRARPTSGYRRRVWFLYEFLTGRRLNVPDARSGNYVPLLDPATHFTGAPRRSARHRVLDNLLGSADYSPMVRRTPALEALERSGLAGEVASILRDYDQDALKRAVSYLYTKETRASFGIEGETPSPDRAERFVGLLQDAERLERVTESELVRLQNATVDARFGDRAWRTEQVYVGEQVTPDRQRIHFVAPRPQDVAPLMKGWLECLARLESSPAAAVVQAAAVSFGFVFIHPFSDGNGRLHRLLIHHVLARRGFTPPGLIFPVSAVMLNRRDEYDACLEAFSVPLMRLTDYEEDEHGVVTVKNATAGFFRYFDATPMAEALARWVAETVRVELRQELDFVVRFRKAREELARVVELPDRLVNLFVKLTLGNQGRLAAGKRKRLFGMLTDREVRSMEGVVQRVLGKARDAGPAGGRAE